MNKIRCFLAIKIDNVSHYQERIKFISEGLDIKFKIMNPLNYHFTLHFFGDLDEYDVEKAHKIFKTLKFQKFKIILSEAGSLPNNKLKSTRVLYIEPSIGKKNIIELISEIRHKLYSDGFQIDKRKPIPHLTVCRVRRGNDIEEFSKKWLLSKFDQIEFYCSSLVLLKSDLTKTGAKYSSLHKYPLSVIENE